MSPASGRSGASGESAGIAERGTSGIRDGAIGSGIAREAAAKAQERRAAQLGGCLLRVDARVLLSTEIVNSR